MIEPVRLGFALHQARKGRDVVVLVPFERDIGPVLTYLEHQLDDGERIHRARMLEAFRRVTGPGAITFLTPARMTHPSGIHADLVIVDEGVVIGKAIADYLVEVVRFADPTLTLAELEEAGTR